ncbi:MAG: hypothetical protein WBR18_04630 [Anaerolineales bacterium]
MASVLRYAADNTPDEPEQQDLLAYVGLALKEIVESVGQSAEAWEKRGYWVKADRFREEWRWAEDVLGAASRALEVGHDGEVIDVFTSLLNPLQGVAPYKRPQDQPSWQGAWRLWHGSGKD